MTTTLHWNSYHYMPYERRLAALEVTRLLKTIPTPTDAGFMVNCQVDGSTARRFTYFAQVCTSGKCVIPDQARLEASLPRKGKINGNDAIPRALRQATRYSAHGLHEYRGKFNPQVVRAALNILDLHTDSLILDPFGGSGTVLLEAAHIGCDAFGTDLHRLAVEIANAKVTAYHWPRGELQAVADRLTKTLDQFIERPDEKDTLRDRLAHFLKSPLEDLLPNVPYLREWFPELVLRQLALILKSIDEQVPAGLRPVFRVIVSDIVRDVSWQEPADLRIRRRQDPAENYPALTLFRESMRKKIATICAPPAPTESDRKQVAVAADTRDEAKYKAQFRKAWGNRLADVVISSPPYATALPYIDIHRLSLCLLGLISNSEIRDAERSLIGNREVSDRERRSMEDELRKNLAELPRGCIDLCRQLLDAAARPGNGFRRRNTPSLLYKYLLDMKLAMKSVAGVMKKDAPLVFVVGPNRCSLGGKDFVIDTPSLLMEIGQAVGFRFEESLPLDAYQRYDLHQQNSIREETMFILRRF